VPCAGCFSCCEQDIIILHPESGDDPALYETVKTVNPLTGKPALMLHRNVDGSCAHLDREAGRCDIYERRPAVCRSFDCRLMFVKFGAAAVRRGIAAGTMSQAVMDAGRKRRHSLEKMA
jgi:Fe-S-cluster containining protein